MASEAHLDAWEQRLRDQEAELEAREKRLQEREAILQDDGTTLQNALSSLEEAEAVLEPWKSPRNSCLFGVSWTLLERTNDEWQSIGWCGRSDSSCSSSSSGIQTRFSGA